MLPHILLTRLNKELADLERDPPPGIICYPVDDDITHLEAYINGPPDSPYQKGSFRLEIHVPLDYPFNPPQIRFKTMIYHPNIDDAGRICADILKKGDNGGWKPSLNLSTTLISLSALMGSPNPDDPLDAEIAQEYRMDHSKFLCKAKELTLKYATGEEAKKDTTMQKQGSKHKLSDEEMLDSLERNTNRAKPKSKLSLSTKKQKSRSSNDMDSSSTPSNSQMTSEAKERLEATSEIQPNKVDNATRMVTTPPVSESGSDVPLDNAVTFLCDNKSGNEVEFQNPKRDTTSNNVETTVYIDDRPSTIEITHVVPSDNKENPVFHNNDPAETHQAIPLGFELSSLIEQPSSMQHMPAQGSSLSQKSSQKANVKNSTITKDMDSTILGKENTDDTVGSQTSVHRLEQDRVTPLQSTKNVNTKELVKETKKDKGKGIYKPLLDRTQGLYGASDGSESSRITSSPSEYIVGTSWRSAFDGFSFENTIDLTSDNDFIPKKRVIDSNKRSKLSLSKSKRQKSQNNAS